MRYVLHQYIGTEYHTYRLRQIHQRRVNHSDKKYTKPPDNSNEHTTQFFYKFPVHLKTFELKNTDTYQPDTDSAGIFSTIGEKMPENNKGLIQ